VVDFGGTIAELAQALQASPLGHAARRSPSFYPAANVVHLAGMTLLVGSALLMDARILGLARSLPLTPLVRLLSWTAAAGLVLIIPSGIVLFSADASSLISSPIFRLKLSAIALALLGAGLFRLIYGDLQAHPAGAPAPAKALAAASMTLWPAAGVMGRLIGYE
jgi:hypothetical protein